MHFILGKTARGISTSSMREMIMKWLLKIFSHDHVREGETRISPAECPNIELSHAGYV